MENTLTWTDGLCEGLLEAASSRPVPAPFTGAHYTIEEDSGFRPGVGPDTQPSWLLTFVYEDPDGDADTVDLGQHQDLDAAKAAAERYEYELPGDIPAAPDSILTDLLPILTDLVDRMRAGSREAADSLYIRALLIKALADMTGDAVLAGLDADELVCALHTLAERESDPDDDNLSERQREVAEKVLVLWSDQVNGSDDE